MVKKAYIIEIYAFLVSEMKRVIGFAMFAFAMGMLFMLFISNEICGFFLIIVFLLVGYHLYCC